MTVLVLDAMGVIYRAGDDVAELLAPFVAAHGGAPDKVEAAYHVASLGRLSAARFWQEVGLSAELEDAYLAGHTLTENLGAFLAAARPHVAGLWCLSNDLTEWSCKLRRRFEIEDLFDGFVISGDIGVRKPDPEIYETLQAAAASPPGDLLLVDDRPRNLAAAADLGWRTVLFDPTGTATEWSGGKVSRLDRILGGLS